MVLEDNTLPAREEVQVEPWSNLPIEVEPQQELAQQFLELKRELAEIKWENRALCTWVDPIAHLDQANDLVEEVGSIPRRNEPAKAKVEAQLVQRKNATKHNGEQLFKESRI